MFLQVPSKPGLLRIKKHQGIFDLASSLDVLWHTTPEWLEHHKIGCKAYINNGLEVLNNFCNRVQLYRCYQFDLFCIFNISPFTGHQIINTILQKQHHHPIRLAWNTDVQSHCEVKQVWHPGRIFLGIKRPVRGIEELEKWLLVVFGMILPVSKKQLIR